MSRTVAVAAVTIAALGLAVDAHAESECGPPPVIVAVQPGADDAALPVGGIARLFYEPGCGEVATVLICDGRAFAETTSEELEFYGVFEHAVLGGVAGSRCELVVSVNDDEVARRSFDVVDEEPAAIGAPTIVSGRMFVDNTDGDVVVDAVPDPLGMSKIEVRTASGILCGVAPVPAEGGRLDMSLYCNAVEVEGTCVRVDQIDVLGRVASAEACLDEARHDGDDAEPEADGCAMAPRAVGSRIAPFVLALVALVVARRRRASARSAT
jgi:hypothetical protein